MLRKLSSLFCVAALSFALVGCADSQVETTTTTPPADETEVDATANTEEPAGDTAEPNPEEPDAEGTN